MRMMGQSIKAAWPVMGILAGILFVYTILALQIFGDTLEPDEYIRFDTFVSLSRSRVAASDRRNR